MSKALDTKLLEATIEAQNEELNDLREELKLKDEFIEKLKNRLYSGKACKTFKTWRKEKSRALEAYLEAMYAAYCIETDIPPDQVILHTAITNDENAHIYYWFERREDNKNLEIAQTISAF